MVVVEIFKFFSSFEIFFHFYLVVVVLMISQV